MMLKGIFMRRTMSWLCATAAIASCDEPADNVAQANVANAATAASEKRTAYCFFKDDETKDWKASLDKSGNVAVSGRAHVKDPRYKPELGQAKVTGAGAEVWPTIVVNSGYASPDNWWDVTFTIPNSANVGQVAVRCGRKTAAELTVKR
jgi:hypothetical protein